MKFRAAVEAAAKRALAEGTSEIQKIASDAGEGVRKGLTEAATAAVLGIASFTVDDIEIGDPKGESTKSGE